MWAFLLLGGWYFDLGRMILWPRADDVLESGGWYFERQWMMFWLLLDDISIREKWKQTLYPLYDWCKLLVFKLLLVDSRPLYPLWSLYRTPYFGAFSLLFFKKMAFIWNKYFHPLERLLPPIGCKVSRLWKQGVQTMDNSQPTDDSAEIVYDYRACSRSTMVCHRANISTKDNSKHKAKSCV